MKILWLAPYVPAPFSGAGTRTFNLIKSLSARSEVDLVAQARDPGADAATKNLSEFCRSVQIVPGTIHSSAHKRRLQLRSLISRRPAQYWMFHSAKMQSAIDRAIHDRAYDLVILEHSFMGYYTRAAGIPTVLDQHNVESEILQRSAAGERSPLRRMYNRLEFKRYAEDERRACRSVDMVVAVSDRDRQTMLDWGGLPECVVIANGVDTEYFAPVDWTGLKDLPQIVFTGSMNYSPNVDAMLWFVEDMWPRIRESVPGASLEIVGQGPPPEVHRLDGVKGIRVTGFVPDVRPYLTAATVVVAPLRIGGGTRLKILEAMAMGRPVVSTSAGCEGLDVEDGQHLQIADGASAFVRQVVGLLRDPARRKALGHSGRQMVVEKYDWKTLGSRLEEALPICAGSKGAWPRSLRLVQAPAPGDVVASCTDGGETRSLGRRAISE